MIELSTLAAPRRREILRLVWDRERSAGEVHRGLGDVTFGAVSQHLKILERAGLIQGRREGRMHYYSARRDRLGPLGEWLESMWSSALYRLKIEAEIEQCRRGPRSSKRKTHTKKRRKTR